MKNYVKKNFLIITIFSLLINLTSCSDSEVSIDEKRSEAKLFIKENAMESLLEEMKLLGNLHGKIIVFDLKDFEKDDFKKHIKVIENSKKIFEFNKGFDSNYKYWEDNFVVTCNYGDGSSETTECGSDAGCAGQATWDCLDNGGCATICSSKIEYYPIQIKPEKSLNSVLSRIEDYAKKTNQVISFSILSNNGTFKLNKVKILDSKNELNKLKEKFGNTNNKTWIVTCFDGDGEVTEETVCEFRDCAGAAIIACTDSGGCAEVCQIFAKYIPNNYVVKPAKIK